MRAKDQVVAGRSALSSFCLLAPVARALECMFYSSDLSPDSKLAFRAEFTDKHLLIGSLFFMVYLVYYQ